MRLGVLLTVNERQSAQYHRVSRDICQSTKHSTLHIHYKVYDLIYNSTLWVQVKPLQKHQLKRKLAEIKQIYEDIRKKLHTMDLDV